MCCLPMYIGEGDVIVFELKCGVNLILFCESICIVSVMLLIRKVVSIHVCRRYVYCVILILNPSPLMLQENIIKEDLIVMILWFHYFK